MEKITDKIAALPHDANYFSLEFFPPKTQMGFSNLQQRLDRMSRALRPLFVNVTWGAGGSTATKSLELAEICQRQLGLTTCLHLTCTNMSRLLVDEALEQAKVLGIRNILALRGDPPRSDEYREEGANPEDDSNNDFTWAVDLVRYIRKQHGDYFCIGVAAYPEGHFDQANQPTQSTDFDLPFLIEKTKAGADFLMTQLFYDVKKYNEYEDRLRNDPSGLFKAIPIIPGLMPIQSYSILRRVTKLSHATLPHDLLARLDAVKSDDEAVKSVGVDIMSEIVESIKGASRTGPRGFHFYTLNLEKAVAQVLQQCQLIPEDEEAETNGIQNGHANGANGANGAEDVAVVETAGTLTPPNGAVKDRRRISSSNSAPRNRVVVDSSRASAHSDREVPDDEAGIPKEKINSRATTLAISEGEGALGREATWDDFPNGRWGDARSPAFGEIDGYGVSLHVSINQAIQLWSHPVTVSDISEIFRRYLNGQVEAVPWSEEALNAETATIRNELLRLNAKGWWTVASQPAINGVHSSDPTHGWGPKNGFVFQKPFVELFLPSRDWEKLKRTLQDTEEVTFFASNGKGEFESSDADSVNPVTWGTFSGKEIVTPTIIEAVSFRAWAEEAFGIWKEWQRIYPPRSPTSVLLENIRKDYWLVNVIHHDFQKTAALWDLLADG